MPLSATDYLLWVTVVILLMLTCWALLKHRFVYELPVFLGYAGYHILRSAALFGINHRMSYNNYFYAFWTAQVISLGLGFCVIYEIYGRVFQKYEAIQRLGGPLFACAAVVLLVVAVLAAHFAPPGADTLGVVGSMFLLERSVRVMQCGLLAFLFVLSFFFGLPWQNRVFGIALGFGVYASIDLAATALSLDSKIGVSATSAYSQVQGIAYACGVLIWTCYLFAPEPVPEPADLMFQVNLQEWNQALLDVWKR